jgi:hypothetical protein
MIYSRANIKGALIVAAVVILISSPAIYERLAAKKVIGGLWQGNYRTMQSWEKETDRRVMVSVLADTIIIKGWFEGEQQTPKFLQVRYAWSTPEKLRVELKDENTFTIKKAAIGVLLVGWSDHYIEGELRDGLPIVGDLGEQNVPVFLISGS